MPTFGSNRKRALKNPPDWDAHAKALRDIKKAQRAESDAPSEEQAQPEPRESEAPAISEMTVAEATALISEADPEELDELAAEEGGGKARKGVLAAIEARRDELEESE